MLQRWWNTKTVLLKVFKLQSNSLRNKYKAEIHKDDGLLGIEFTLDKTIFEFIYMSEKLAFPSSAMCSLVATRLTGSKCSTSTSRSLLTQNLLSQCKIAPWLRTSLRVIDLFLNSTLNEKKTDERDCRSTHDSRPTCYSYCHRFEAFPSGYKDSYIDCKCWTSATLLSLSLY